MSKKAVVVFSGGQDSTTILGHVLRGREFGDFEAFAIGFDYGQRHKIELEQAKKIAAILNVPYKIIDVRSFGQLVTSALVNEGSVSEPHSRMASVPNSFVPNRNALFLTIAHAYAQEVGAGDIYAGMCQTDYSGYPDCRRMFINELESALNLGYNANINIRTPLMYATKAQTFKIAEDAGVLDLVLDHSHTCYEGLRGSYNGRMPGRWDWGHGCGECPACKLREKGYAEFMATKGT